MQSRAFSSIFPFLKQGFYCVTKTANAAFNLMLSCRVSPVLLLTPSKSKRTGQAESLRQKLCLAVIGIPGAVALWASKPRYLVSCSA